MSLDLAAELADNDAADRAERAFVDPRTIPSRHSLLKTMSQSPAHYLEACQSGQDDDDSLAARLGSFASDRKECLRVGRAIHAHLTATGPVIEYPGRRDPRSKAWQDFQAEAATRGVVEILSPKEMAIVRGVACAVREREDAMHLLFGPHTIVEQRLDWSWMGKAMRSTPDSFIPGRYSVDLKSTISSDPMRFKRQAFALGYHAQAALYRRAIAEAGHEPPTEAFVVAVEKTRPHAVTVFRFDENAIEAGEKLTRLWIERLLQCEAANVWPTYAPAPAIVELGFDDEGAYA